MSIKSGFFFFLLKRIIKLHSFAWKRVQRTPVLHWTNFTQYWLYNTFVVKVSHKKVDLKCNFSNETDFEHWNSAWDLLENCWQIFSSGTLLDFLILMVNYVVLQVNMIIKQVCKQTNIIFPRCYWTSF